MFEQVNHSCCLRNTKKGVSNLYHWLRGGPSWSKYQARASSLEDGADGLLPLSSFPNWVAMSLATPGGDGGVVAAIPLRVPVYRGKRAARRGVGSARRRGAARRKADSGRKDIARRLTITKNVSVSKGIAGSSSRGGAAALQGRNSSSSTRAPIPNPSVNRGRGPSRKPTKPYVDRAFVNAAHSEPRQEVRCLCCRQSFRVVFRGAGGIECPSEVCVAKRGFFCSAKRRKCFLSNQRV